MGRQGATNWVSDHLLDKYRFKMLPEMKLKQLESQLWHWFYPFEVACHYHLSHVHVQLWCENCLDSQPFAASHLMSDDFRSDFNRILVDLFWLYSLEHVFLFPIYWEWLLTIIFFGGVAQPPSSIDSSNLWHCSIPSGTCFEPNPSAPVIPSEKV